MLKIELNRDGDKYIIHNAPRSLVNQLVEVKYDGLVTETPVTDISATVVWKYIDSLSDDARLLTQSIMLESQRLSQNAIDVARFKESGLTPRQLTLHEENPLSDYQVIGAHLCQRNRGFGLFMEQGTGKTACVIAALCQEVLERGSCRAIIVTPNNVRMNWIAELERFATCEYTAAVMRGSKLNRVKTLIEVQTSASPLKICIVSYDGMCNTFEAIEHVKWDYAVLDESHYIKWPGTQRSKVAMRLRDCAAKRLCLTGTPVTNHALDLYSQFEFMEKYGSGFKDWKSFRKFYGVWEPTTHGDKLVGIQNLRFMKERLARRSYIVRKDEVLKLLPAKMYSIHEVEMSSKQKEAYEQMRSELRVQFGDMLNDIGEVSAASVNTILTQLLRLAQITSGFVVWDSRESDDGTIVEGGYHLFDPNPKIEAVLELIKGNEHKVIVWACFRYDIAAICNALTQHGIDHVRFDGSTSEKARGIAEFEFNNNPMCKVFVGNPAAGGTGLNLLGYPPGQEDVESDCDMTIYYSQGWSMVHRTQSEDRNHRRGTRRPVRVVDLCVPGTIDEEIRSRVVGKRAHALEVGDIRSILKKLLV